MEAIYSNDWYGEFKNYCLKHLGISTMQLYYWEKMQDTLYSNVKASMTPYVPEPNKLEVTMIDIFSRLMMDRKLWLAGPVNEQMSIVVSAQLLYLETLSPDEDITMHIDTPGGSVKCGLSIVDTMNYVSPDIVTINTGIAASMGSILLGAGTKGKRYTLPFSKVMLHQVSFGAEGNIQDVRIRQNEAEKYNKLLFDLLAKYCGKRKDKVMKDATRDLWLDSKEALEYGIVDEIISK